MFVLVPMTYLDTKVHCRAVLQLENNNLQLRMVYKLPLMFLMNLKNHLFLMNLKFLKNPMYRLFLNYR
jgi:hypothetical protein